MAAAQASHTNHKEADSFMATMKPLQHELLMKQLATIQERSPFYAQKFAGIDMSAIRTQEDFERLPFSEKADLREAYPLGIQAVPDEKVVRIHSSSGTTGTPVIIPYTQKDVDDWADMFARCYRTIGCTERDRIHITPGYGLWTAGIGFQLGAERMGAMAIPMGPGNTEKQLRMMVDLQSTVLCATSSYALLLAERIAQEGIRDRLALKKGLIGSERWGAKMRSRIANELGVELYDIYGLTEIYGPGIGVNCSHGTAMHVWDDYVYLEVVDPKTGKVLPDGEVGELVITTLVKEGAPLIRYRTHDLTSIVLGDCPCGMTHTRITQVVGRTDDMFKVKGVNMFPAQVEEVCAAVDGVSSEYQVMIDHLNGKDIMTVYFETETDDQLVRRDIEDAVLETFKNRIGVTVVPKAVGMGELPRSEKKSTRIYDNRY
jgi:phenylacetate-CoA ligase